MRILLVHIPTQPEMQPDYVDHKMDQELYKFREPKFDFKDKSPQFRSLVYVLNVFSLNVKPYWTYQVYK